MPHVLWFSPSRCHALAAARFTLQDMMCDLGAAANLLRSKGPTQPRSEIGRTGPAIRPFCSHGEVYPYVAVVVKTVLGSQFGVGEFTTHFRTYFSGWIGMFTGGTGF